MKNCPNCGKAGSHFVLPSLGDEGFYVCEKQTPSVVFQTVPSENFMATIAANVDNARPDAGREKGLPS